jgi:hypothetical protein
MSHNKRRGSFAQSLLYGRILLSTPLGDGQTVGYRITVRSLERKLVGEQVFGELASLEDASALNDRPFPPVPAAGKFVIVLEEEDGPFQNAPRRPE